MGKPRNRHRLGRTRDGRGRNERERDANAQHVRRWNAAREAHTIGREVRGHDAHVTSAASFVTVDDALQVAAVMEEERQYSTMITCSCCGQAVGVPDMRQQMCNATHPFVVRLAPHVLETCDPVDCDWHIRALYQWGCRFRFCCDCWDVLNRGGRPYDPDALTRRQRSRLQSA